MAGPVSDGPQVFRVPREALRAIQATGGYDAPPTAAQVTEMVDETAKAEMRRQGRDPDAWDRLPSDVRDELRLLALDRLRRLA